MPPSILIDSNVILDIFLNDPKWADWSEDMLNRYSQSHRLYINSIIYSEISIGLSQIEPLENAIAACGFYLLEIPREALFLAGKAFVRYKKQKGLKRSILPDFFIGAHAAVAGMDLLTRDTRRYQTYFPTIKIIAP